MPIKSLPSWIRDYSPILLSALLYLLFYTFFTQTYLENDDVIMQSIVSGKFGGTPNEYLIFSNVIIGLILKKLYLLHSGLNWYQLLLMLCHFIATSSIFYSIQRTLSNPAYYLISSVFFFFFFQFEIVQYLSFTTASGIIGIAGTLLLLQLNKQSRSSRLEFGLAITCLIICALVRESVFIEIIILFLPIYVLLKLFKSRRINISLFVTISLFAISHAYNDSYFKDDWKEFKTYNKARGGLHENNYFESFNYQLPEVLDKHQWSQTDYYFFKKFYFDLSPQYSLEKLNEIKSSLDALRLEVYKHPSLFKDLSYLFLYSINNYWKLFVLILLLFLFLKAYSNKDLWLITIYFLGLMAALTFYGFPLKNRVTYIPIVLYSLTFMIGELKKKQSKYLFFTFVIISVFSLINGIYSHFEIEKETELAIKRKQQVDQIIDGRLTALYHDAFNFERVALTDIGAIEPNYFILGWTSGIPLNNKKMNNGKIESVFQNPKTMQWLFNDSSIVDHRKMRSIMVSSLTDEYSIDSLVDLSEHSKMVLLKFQTKN